MEHIISTDYYYCENKDIIKLINSATGEWNIIQRKNIGLPIKVEGEWNPKFIEFVKGTFKQETSNVEMPCNDKFNLIIIDTTNSCNLSCKYCSVDANEMGKRLEKGIAVKGVRTILDLPNISSLVTIEFSGGEPLVNFALIKEIVPEINVLAQERGLEIKYAIQSNGVLINGEIASFLAKNDFSVGISIDGDEIWNQNRIDSKGRSVYSGVLKCFEILRAHGVTSFSTLGVVYNPKQYDAYIKFAYNNQIHRFRLNTLTNIGRSKRQMDTSMSVVAVTEDYVERYVDMAKELILNPRYKGVKEANLEYYLWALLDWQPHMCFRTPCGAGRNQLHISSKGEIYPCQDWRSIGDLSLGYIQNLTNLKENIECSKRITQMNLPNFKRFPELCNNCAWKMRCGVCSRELYTEYNNDGEKIGLCNFQNGVYESLVELIYSNTKEVMEYLEVV